MKSTQNVNLVSKPKNYTYKMNATSLYVSTSRLVFQSNGMSDQNWTDLYRLIPYLRQALSCTVCQKLLTEPYTPVDVNCQHHVCRLCLRGRKNLKPSCNWCKDYESYEKNIQLRILLQCYKSLCEYIKMTPIYEAIQAQSKVSSLINNGVSIPSLSLVEFIEEGVNFEDNFKSNAGLSKSAYSILPCVFSNTPANTNNSLCLNNPQISNVIKVSPVQQKTAQILAQPPPIKTVSNGSAMYSVLYTGIGNKITIKRKTDGEDDCTTKVANKFSTIVRPKAITKRRGCRCGNATATPGKLTCCGQRCPCYVESKSCIDCKCRGCRNPHRPDGGKIRPHIPELACYEIQVADDSTNIPTNNLAQNQTSNCLEIPLDDFNASCLAPVRNTTKTIPLTSHQLRHLESVNSESLLISSPEGNFQVLNVFTSPHQNLSLHQAQNHRQRNQTDHQMPDITATLPQILMQHDQISPTTILTSPPGLPALGSRQSTLTISPGVSSLIPTTITLSPIIVTSTSPFSSQLFGEEEIITSPNQPPPLIDLIRNETTCSGTLNV